MSDRNDSKPGVPFFFEYAFDDSHPFPLPIVIVPGAGVYNLYDRGDLHPYIQNAEPWYVKEITPEGVRTRLVRCSGTLHNRARWFHLKPDITGRFFQPNHGVQGIVDRFFSELAKQHRDLVTNIGKHHIVDWYNSSLRYGVLVEKAEELTQWGPVKPVHDYRPPQLPSGYQPLPEPDGGSITDIQSRLSAVMEELGKHAEVHRTSTHARRLRYILERAEELKANSERSNPNEFLKEYEKLVRDYKNPPSNE